VKIRQRLTLLYSTILLTIIIFFGMAVFGILDRTLRVQVDDNLSKVLNDVEKKIWASFNEDYQLDYTPYAWPNTNTFQSPGVYIQLWHSESDTPINLSQNLWWYHYPLDKRMLHVHKETYTDKTTEDGVHLRVLTRPMMVSTGNGEEPYPIAHLQAATSLESIENATDRLLKIMLVGGVFAVVISVILGNWLAGRALRPISKITDTAQGIVAAEDLSRRIPYDGTNDELGSLTTTINEMLSRLEKLFNTQRRFVADVSHELRTPVTAIQGHVELLQRIGSDPDSLMAIESESKRMARLVGDLLLLAQADVGRLPLNITDVELDTLLLAVYNQAKVLNQKNIQVRLGHLEPIIVKADSDRLKQLLLNLVTNSLKYTPDDGKLILSLRTQGEWVEISVEDTGTGIPAEDLPQIFDRFYRVDRSRTREAGGTGLGLAIAKWIAESHHGTLSVMSEMGKGTTFVLRLPLHSDTEDDDGENTETRRLRLPGSRIMRS
jgi:heavy metal sensor kinase